MYSTAVDRYNGTVYAGGPDGLYKSRDGGTSWRSVGHSSMTDGAGFTESQENWKGVHQVLTNQTQNRVYVAVYKTSGTSGGLYLSTDSTATWTQLRQTLYARAVDVNWTTQQVLLLGSSKAYTGGGYAVDSEGLLRSDDGGSTWTDTYTNGLPFKFVARVITDPFDFEKIIVGSPGNGFFHRTIECGDPCAIERQGGGASARRAPVAEGGDVVLSLGGPQPNPSTGRSTLTWSIPPSGEGRSFELSLYDVAGRRVQTIVVGTARSGRFTKDLNFTSAEGEPLKGGVFFVRLRLGDQILRRTVVLAR